VPDHQPNDRPNLDAAEEVIERLEWADGRQDDTPHKRWHDLTRRTALTGGAAGVAAFILEACGGGKKTSSTGTSTAAAAGSPASGVIGSQP
jgi:simple sugar transport system substrate-binding protein